MTVRIIGEAPEMTKQCTCRGCGARLEYVPCDTKLGVHYDYSGGRDSYRFIQCPRCHKEITVS